MLFTDKDGITFDDGIDLRFKTQNIKDFRPNVMRLTLGDLRKIVNASPLPDDTPILYDNISEKLLLADSGWMVTPMHWETHEYEGESYTEYQPCIPAGQIFTTEDKDGTVGLVLTAHY
jgi:hypothetical protein